MRRIESKKESPKVDILRELGWRRMIEREMKLDPVAGRRLRAYLMSIAGETLASLRKAEREHGVSKI